MLVMGAVAGELQWYEAAAVKGHTWPARVALMQKV